VPAHRNHDIEQGERCGGWNQFILISTTYVFATTVGHDTPFCLECGKDFYYYHFIVIYSTTYLLVHRIHDNTRDVRRLPLTPLERDDEPNGKVPTVSFFFSFSFYEQSILVPLYRDFNHDDDAGGAKGTQMMFGP
jgi:hypothetical protein